MLPSFPVFFFLKIRKMRKKRSSTINNAPFFNLYARSTTTFLYILVFVVNSTILLVNKDMDRFGTSIVIELNYSSLHLRA